MMTWMKYSAIVLFAGALLTGCASTSKVCTAGFDMKIHKIEVKTSRQITEVEVVRLNLFAGIDQLDVAEFGLFHRLKVRKLFVDSRKIQLRGLIRVHPNELRPVSRV